MNCPTLREPRITTPITPIACTSLTVLSSAAKRAGLKRTGDETTLDPASRITTWEKTSLLPKSADRSVFLTHTDNGAVTQARCAGIVAATLDPVFTVCSSIGRATAIDAATVRAWALKAERTIAAKPTTILRLNRAGMQFAACQSSLYPHGSAAVTFEMYLFAADGGRTGQFENSNCND